MIAEHKDYAFSFPGMALKASQYILNIVHESDAMAPCPIYISYLGLTLISLLSLKDPHFSPCLLSLWVWLAPSGGLSDPPPWYGCPPPWHPEPACIIVPSGHQLACLQTRSQGLKDRSVHCLCLYPQDLTWLNVCRMNEQINKLAKIKIRIYVKVLDPC